MAEMAAKVLLQGIKHGTDMIPDKYWERVPGMRPPKNEQEYKATKAKVDADEAKNGRFGTEKRTGHDKKNQQDSKSETGHRDDRHRDDRHRDDKHRDERRRHGYDRDDQHRHSRRPRSQSDERRNDRRRDRGARAERRKLERRPSSYSPPMTEDEGFYNDAEKRRQDRRAQKYFCNDPSHQQWDRREHPASMNRPYVPMPQPGGAPSPYAQDPRQGPATGPPPGPPVYNPLVFQQAPYGQQVPLPRPPQGSSAPLSYAAYQSPPDSRRSSAQVPAGFSPQVSSPYAPASAANSRPVSQAYSYSRPQTPQQSGLRAQMPPPSGPAPSMQQPTQPVPVPQAAQQPRQQYFSPPPVQQQAQAPPRVASPGVVSPSSSTTSGNSSKAAQKYTPQGVAIGNDMYAKPE